MVSYSLETTPYFTFTQGSISSVTMNKGKESNLKPLTYEVAFFALLHKERKK